jgi:hypothetical protein
MHTKKNKAAMQLGSNFDDLTKKDHEILLVGQLKAAILSGLFVCYAAKFI